ncbi:MAG: glycosyltransferase family 4 protein [Vicinamibacterales bacterium]
MSVENAAAQNRSDPRPAGPVRVVRMIARLNVGGPARHATTLDAGLRAHDIETLLVHGSVDSSEGSLEDLVPALGLRALKIPELGRRIAPWSDARALWRLATLIFRERPDVVHTHTAKAGTLGRLAAYAYNVTRPRNRRCVVIHTFHGHVLKGYFGPVGDAAVRLAERTLGRMTDRVVAISLSQRRDICDVYRVAPPGRTVVVELGLDLEQLLTLAPDTRLRRELGIDGGEIVFGYVGRLVPIKNLDLLLDAFSLLVSRVPNARLVVAGDGQSRAALEQRAQALGTGGRVAFLGWRRDLDAIYAGIDVGVLSSLNEGTPVALIETMAARHPVVATAVGGVEDVVSHDRNGLVVALDATAMADAMERLARDSELRGRMGEAGRRDVAARYGHARLALEISRLYREALAEKREGLR